MQSHTIYVSLRHGPGLCGISQNHGNGSQEVPKFSRLLLRIARQDRDDDDG